jgi:3D-(3,5/4)-trihydroxycyclohexane-1,2-dione acylhydrolase (decyclizing)
LSDFTTASHSLFQNPNVRFVSVNVNAADAAKLAASAVVADAREGLDALREALVGWTSPSGYGEAVGQALGRWRAELADDVAPRTGEPMGQGEVLRAIERTVRGGDWVVAAAGWQPGDLLKAWETPAGSFTHIEFAFSCMGHEIPAGLGIRLHAGDGPEVIVVIGDGTYLMSPTELVTAVQEDLKLIVVVLDNGGYQSINRLALGYTGAGAGNELRRRGAGGRFPDGERVAVDYVANAGSMGCEAVLAETVDELDGALRGARDVAATTVIVCPTAPERALLSAEAFWDLGVPEVAADELTRRLTAEHLVRAEAQRRY